jgi:hypothetical protein
MLKLNRTRSEYRVRMYWYPCIGERNGILQFSNKGKMFHCSFASTQDVASVTTGQGIKYKALELETDAVYDFKVNDKITYLSYINRDGVKVPFEYRVTGVSIDNNSISGSDYTNKPNSLIKYISVEG